MEALLCAQCLGQAAAGESRGKVVPRHRLAVSPAAPADGEEDVLGRKRCC